MALINDLLDIARIEAGRVELQRVPTALRPILVQATSTLRVEIDKKQQTLVTEAPPNLPSLDIDSDRITRVLTNLLSNAHKYTPAGGAISVRAAVAGSEVTVEVQDTGIGLSAGDLEHLFDKFFRSRNVAAQGIRGTGLGLAITKSIVEMHGGRIWVDSRLGEGTTVSFTLPVAGTAEEPPREPVPDRAAVGLPRSPDEISLPLPASRVLVVDDDPGISGLLRRYLERAGYSVVTTALGEEAIRLAETEAFDVVTLDIMLPDIDGIAVLEQLRENPITAQTPVLLISVLPPEDDGKTLQAVDYLTKPVNERVLLGRIEQILRDRQSRQVLVVDDEADIRRLFVETLRRGGYEPLEAADGLEAVELARRHVPGAILLDVRMPRCDGIEALRRLRADETTRHIPVILMTASPGALDANREEVVRLGVVELLDKPTAPEDVVAFLRRQLGPGANAG